MGRLLAAILLFLSVAPTSAQVDGVEISFPTSGSGAAQPHFLRAVYFLDSFGWNQAIAEFREAQRLQPDFAMAYWGETLCYNHPLAPEQDAKSPREVLARLGPTPAARLAKAPTDREKALLRAVEVLWGVGDWRARRVGYMHAMERVARQYPDDDEIQNLYALSLLSGARALDDDTFRYEMEAGAVAQRVLQHNPKDPGALHYTIHAYDDPTHAPLALDAAREYAKIVPDVSHAVHMPSHVFIQLGMWKEVATSNVRAFNIARGLFRAGDSAEDLAHSGDWGQYGFLQLGDYAGARGLAQAMEDVLARTPNRRLMQAVELTRARYITETEDWTVRLLPDRASSETVFANGMSAVHQGDTLLATQMLNELAKRSDGAETRAEESPADESDDVEQASPHANHDPRSSASTAGSGRRAVALIMQRELAATIAMASGDPDEAIALLKEAVQIESGMRPPNGAARPIKPALELLGEGLLAAGRPAEAASAFDASLLRMPNRARSLMGSARAHALAGSSDLAQERYRSLTSFWEGAAVGAPTPSRDKRRAGKPSTTD
ncbi:MAG: tetratricopeptide repeat protein [Amaricoccus sp.]